MIKVLLVTDEFLPSIVEALRSIDDEEKIVMIKEDFNNPIKLKYEVPPIESIKLDKSYLRERKSDVQPWKKKWKR